MSIRDVFNTLNSALYALTCIDASLQDRLTSAIAEVTDLKEEDFPPDFRAEARKLLAIIHVDFKSNDRSDMQSDIALAILELYTNLVANTGMVSK